jgi:hypothetical protein
MSDILSSVKNCLPSKETCIEVVNTSVIVIFFLIVGYLIYFHLGSKSYDLEVNNNDSLVLYKNEPISTKQFIKNSRFTPPISGYAISFTLLISDFYSDYSTWRHILHKGSQLEPSENTNFDSLNSQGTNRQYPGIWLHPETNSLRIVLSTQKKKNETFDIEHIDVGNWTEICLNIHGRTCEVYINGLLTRTFECKSEIEYNSGDMYILYGDNVQWGKIKNVRYIPNYLDAKIFKYIQQIDNNKKKII